MERRSVRRSLGGFFAQLQTTEALISEKVPGVCGGESGDGRGGRGWEGREGGESGTVGGRGACPDGRDDWYASLGFISFHTSLNVMSRL